MRCVQLHRKKIMGNASLETAVHRSHPQREHHLSAYLENYQAGVQPSEQPASPDTSSQCSSLYSINPSRSSSRSSDTHSRSSRCTYYFVGTCPAQDLSTTQAAILKARIKHMELEDIRCLDKHENQVDMECKLLDDRAKEGRRLTRTRMAAPRGRRSAPTRRMASSGGRTASSRERTPTPRGGTQDKRGTH